MTKKQVAQVIAKRMNRINDDVNIDRMTKLLVRGMSDKELNALLDEMKKENK